MVDETLSVHCIPCNTKFRGRTDIKENFVPVEENLTVQDGVEQPQRRFVAHLRGRRLLGSRVDVAPGFVGRVLHIPMKALQKSSSGGETRKRERSPSGSALHPHLRDNSIECGAAGKLVGESEDTGNVTSVGSFTALTVWEHDREPAKAMANSCELWTDIAEALHRRIKS